MAPGKALSTRERRGSIAWRRVVVPHVFNMKRFSETSMLLSLCVRECKFGNEQQNNSRVRSSCLKRCKIHNMTCSIKVDSFCSPQQVCIHTVVATLAEDLAVYQTENLLPLTPEMNGLLETLYTHNYAYNSSVT